MDRNPDGNPQSAELSIARTFDAPRALVWTVWTEPNHAAQWWGPHGFTTPVYETDLRPGGRIRVHMRAPDGTIFPSEGAYEEVVAPERLVSFGVVEIGGQVAFEVRMTVTFEEHDGKTTVRVLQSFSKLAPAAAGAIAGARQGWTQQLDRLEAYLREQAASVRPRA
jgi:uncharacterized protein YndB with AHSA1/START domain